MEVDIRLAEEESEPRSSSILANPAKFESLIKFGRSLQELSQEVPNVQLL